MAQIVLVTGVDTGVGKTVFTSALTRYLRVSGQSVLALKPLASGDRSDAEALFLAQDQRLSLDNINPWWFRAPLAPAIAAEHVGRRVLLADLCQHIQSFVPVVGSKGWLVVEMAGGLLSPLCQDGDALELIRKLGARPVVVAENRLGVLHAIEAVWRLWNRRELGCARLILRNGLGKSLVHRTNRTWLTQRWGESVVIPFPDLTEPQSFLKSRSPLSPRLRRSCEQLLGSWS